MKLIRYTLLGILSLTLVIVSLLFQVGLTLNSTLLSEKSFAKNIDRNNVGSMAINIFNHTSFGSELLFSDTFKSSFIKHLDPNFTNKEIPKILKVTQGYLVGTEKTLPIIDITSVKTALLEAKTDEILNNASRSGLSLRREDVRNSVTQDLNLNKTKDNLDLNLVLDNSSNSNKNIAEALRDVVTTLKTVSTITFAFILAMLLILIALIDYRSKKIILWQMVPLTISGLISIIFSLCILFSYPFKSNFNTIDAIRALIQNFVNSFFIVLLVYGVIFSILPAIIMGLYKYFYLRKLDDDTRSDRKTFFHNSTIRLIMALFIIAIIFFAAINGYQSISSKIITFKNISENTDIQQGLIKSSELNFYRS